MPQQLHEYKKEISALTESCLALEKANKELKQKYELKSHAEKLHNDKQGEEFKNRQKDEGMCRQSDFAVVGLKIVGPNI